MFLEAERWIETSSPFTISTIRVNRASAQNGLAQSRRTRSLARSSQTLAGGLPCFPILLPTPSTEILTTYFNCFRVLEPEYYHEVCTM